MIILDARDEEKPQRILIDLDSAIELEEGVEPQLDVPAPDHSCPGGHWRSEK